MIGIVEFKFYLCKQALALYTQFPWNFRPTLRPSIIKKYCHADMGLGVGGTYRIFLIVELGKTAKSLTLQMQMLPKMTLTPV